MAGGLSGRKLPYVRGMRRAVFPMHLGKSLRLKLREVGVLGRWTDSDGDPVSWGKRSGWALGFGKRRGKESVVDFGTCRGKNQTGPLPGFRLEFRGGPLPVLARSD